MFRTQAWYRYLSILVVLLVNSVSIPVLSRPVMQTSPKSVFLYVVPLLFRVAAIDTDELDQAAILPKPDSRFKFIGIPAISNQVFHTWGNEGFVEPPDPECRLEDATECCGDLWQLHWFEVYNDLENRWSWYLEVEAQRPGTWLHVPRELPKFTVETFRAPMKAVQVELLDRTIRGPPRIAFQCSITLDARDVLFHRAVMRRPEMVLRITRPYIIHCHDEEKTDVAPQHVRASRDWMGGRRWEINVDAWTRHFCTPMTEQEKRELPIARGHSSNWGERANKRARSQSAVQIEGPSKRSCLTLDHAAIQSGSLISAYLTGEPRLQDADSSEASNSIPTPRLGPSYRAVYDQIVEQLFNDDYAPPQSERSSEIITDTEHEKLRQAEAYTRLLQEQWEREKLYALPSVSLSATLPGLMAGQDNIQITHAIASASPTYALQHIVTSTEWDVIRANPDSKVQACATTDDQNWNSLWQDAASFKTSIFDPPDPFLLDG